jgi:hypothetical protein
MMVMNGVIPLISGLVSLTAGKDAVRQLIAKQEQRIKPVRRCYNTQAGMTCMAGMAVDDHA